jgi:hypothetical protein
MSIFGIGFILYDAIYYDFTPSTKENPYGVAARVLIQPTYHSSLSQQKNPIEPQDTLWFRYTSQEPIRIMGYNICNGILCINNKSEGYSQHNPKNFDKPQKWAGGTLGDLPWNVGDTVHIRVKIQPVMISEDGAISTLDDHVLFVDLGKSKILKVSS